MTNKKAKTPEVTPFVWTKGINERTVELGGAKLKYRGMTYDEVLHMAPMSTADGNILTIKMCNTGIEGIEFDGKPYTPAYEDYKIGDRTVKILTEQAYIDIYGSRYALINNALEVISELTGLSEAERETQRFFRS